MFALADARPEMDNGGDLPSDLHLPMTTKEVPCDSTEKDCSDDWDVPRSKKQDDLIILGDGIAQRNEEHLDEKENGHGHTHCSPDLGGGVCPPMFPVCCGNGHCGKTGPC